jgi:DNA-binding response OmpR family regulator
VTTEHAVAGAPVAQPARILVADADADSRALYSASFAPRPWTIVEALDGRDALVKALTRPPSALITELWLPIIDGVALCEILRRDRVTAHVPIAVVTAEARSSEATRALRAGADVVLTKPTRLETLVRTLEQLVERSGTLRKRSEAAVAQAAVDVERSEELRAKRHVMLSRTNPRWMTTTPELPPPELTCQMCDAPLKYEHSFIGGVSERHREQWDYYTCARCGMFQYRQRTKKLRRVE